MSSLLIFDYNAPSAYDAQLQETQGFGGTEATVIRIAHALSDMVPVVVCQRRRKEIKKIVNVTYIPYSNELLAYQWKGIIVIRNLSVALDLKAKYPNTPVWLWLHDLIQPIIAPWLSVMEEKEIGIVVVSDFHRNQLLELYTSNRLLKNTLRVERIYNPIADDLKPDGTAVDPNKLLFASAPHKGFVETLAGFKVLHKRYPRFQLFVSNPSYLISSNEPVKGVTFLGTLTHSESIIHMRSAACLFYLNHVYPETFGLVLAEANAVGTPVLTHALGAAPEVLLNQEQIIDTQDTEAVIRRLLYWDSGHRPNVQANETFRLSNVIKHWAELLELRGGEGD